MFGNGGPGDRESGGDLPGRLPAFAQQVEHGPARRVGQRAESSFRRYVTVWFRMMRNSTVTRLAL